MDMSAVRGIALDRRVRVAVDVMGSDHGPEEVIPGALSYATSHPLDDLVLVGDEKRIRTIAGELPSNVTIVHASQVVEMHEQPAMALREKKDASIMVAVDLVKRGAVDGMVTAGHTGAGMAAAVLRLGRLPGVDRPALALQLSTDQGPFVLLDIGANPGATAENLYQYAYMGSIFARRVLGIERPRVALLSIGEEKGKGDARIQKATELLDQSDLEFIGNVEGRDIPKRLADVVVCDAVVGNVTMKLIEGLSGYIFGKLKAEFKRPPWGPIAYLLMKPGIQRLRGAFDYERYGSSPLLGCRGTVLITHGSAKRRMIYYAVEVAAAAVRAEITEAIGETFRRPDILETGAAGAELRLPAAAAAAAVSAAAAAAQAENDVVGVDDARV